MNYKLPIVSLLTAAFALTWIAASTRKDLAPAAGKAQPASPDSQETPDPDRVLRDAVAAVRQLANVSGQIRLRTQVFGMQVASAGKYRQWNDGNALRFRLDLRTQAGDITAHYMQFSDGRFLWSRRELPSQRTLQRADWAQIRRRLSDARAQGRMPARPPALAGLSYGLADILTRIAEQFDMESARRDRIGREDIPVIVLAGRLKQSILKTHYPAAAKDVMRGNLSQLPEPVPTHVEVVLGDDDILRLFPYRIAFLRRETAGVVRLMDLEFFSLTQNAPVDPQDFQYDPGGQPMEDITEQILDQLLPSDSGDPDR